MSHNQAPTRRQEKAFKIKMEKGGTMGEILRETGYSPAVVKSPTKVTKTKGWKELMDTYLPEDELAKKHKYLLSNDRKEETQTKALDMGYRLRGNYAPDKQIHVNLSVKEFFNEIENENRSRDKTMESE